MVVASGQGLEAGNCSCGLLGPACDVTGWVNFNDEVTPTPVTNFPDGVCSEQGACVVVGSGQEMVDVLAHTFVLVLPNISSIGRWRWSSPPRRSPFIPHCTQ